MVGLSHFATVDAFDQVGQRDEIVSPAIALPMPADTLLWKRSHC
jgi:hypothetical protein